MGTFDSAKRLFREEPWLMSASLGLACALTAMNGMRLNTIDGIYPVELSLTLRHLLATLTALTVLFLSSKMGRPVLSTSPRRVFAVAGFLALALLMRYSPYLFIAEVPGLMLVGKLIEESIGALLVLAWAESIVGSGLRRTVTVFGLAVFGMGAIQVLLTLFQRVPCMLALVVLPLVSAALFKTCFQRMRRDADTLVLDERDNLQTVDISRSSLIALLCIVVLCFVFTTGQILQPTLVIQERNFSSQLSIAVGNVLAGICILTVACASDRVSSQPRVSFALFFLAMFALTTVALSLMNYLDSVIVTVYLVLASLGTFLIMLVVWALPFARLPRGWTPFTVVALGYVCNFAARMISTVVMNFAAANPGFPVGLIAGGALALALCCSVACIIGMTDSVVQSALGCRPAVGGDLANAGTPPSASCVAAPHKDAVASLCDAYGLTAQEGKVLSLCSKGKNARSVSEELGVSLNTTKSHMRVIYSNLGIHSQQELIKLVDEAFAEARRVQ